MRISAINPISANETNSNYSAVKNNKKNFYSTNNLSKDVISFGGKNVPTETLDEYLVLLGEISKINRKHNDGISAVTKNSDKLLENVNKKIKPLCENSDLLWTITPEHKREQYSRFAVLYLIENGPDEENTNKVIDIIFPSIEKRILKENPQIILTEIEEAEAETPTLAENMTLKKLKGYLSKKVTIKNNLYDKLSEIDLKYYRQKVKITNSMDTIRAIAKVDTVTFNRELTQRAIQKKPDLKNIYSEAYKKNYDKVKEIYKKGTATQYASKQASKAVIDYLANEHVEDLPF